ncbi:MAG: hypothetical protein AB1486_12105 [Planctomycetota bacterium]
MQRAEVTRLEARGGAGSWLAAVVAFGLMASGSASTQEACPGLFPGETVGTEASRRYLLTPSAIVEIEAPLPGRVFAYRSVQGSTLPSPPPGLGEMDTLWPALRFPPHEIVLGGEAAPLSPPAGSPAGAGDGPGRIKLVGRALDEGGQCRDVLCHGNYCYAGTTGNLAVYDVSAPEAPVLVHEFEEPAPRLARAGSLLAAVMGRGMELVLFDATDPALPVESSRLAPPEEFFFRQLAMTDSLVIAIGWGYLEGFGWADILQVVDITDPGAPVVKSTLIGLDDYFRAVLIEQNLVYLFIEEEGIAILDVSNPEDIVQLGFVQVYPYIDDMCLAGDLLYLAGNGMEIVDVSDPSAPFILSQWGNAYTPGIVVAGSFAYVTDDDDRTLHVVDVSNPADPIGRGELQPYGRAEFVDVSGTTVFVCDRDYGLLAVDVNDPAEPVLLSMTCTGYYVTAIDVEDGLGTVTANLSTVHMVDLSDPFAPGPLGSTTAIPDSLPNNTPWNAGVDTRGAVAVVSDLDEGINIYDVGDPNAPVLVSSLSLAGGLVYPVVQMGNLVYVGTNEIVILDISDPAHPVQVGTGPAFGGFLSDIVIHGTTGYACDYDEIAIFDVANPLAPVELSRITMETGRNPRVLALDGDVLGAAWFCFDGTVWYGAHGGFDLYDVSDPLTPTPIRTLQDPAMLHASYTDISLRGEGGRFYMSCFDQLVVIECSDPASARVAAVYPDTPGAWQVGWLTYCGLTTADNLIYLCGHAGLEVLRYLDVGVFLYPPADPVIVPPGSSVTFDVEVKNFTTAWQMVELWTILRTADGTPVGPYSVPVTMTLAPGQTFRSTMERWIPLGTPPADYLLYAHVGAPGTEFDQDRFAIRVSGT